MSVCAVLSFVRLRSIAGSGRLVVSCLMLLWTLVLAGLPAAERPLRVALTGQYPPFSMYDADGQLAGFDVDVSRAVARHLGRDLQLIATQWDGILPGLLAGHYDVIIGSMAITEERSRQVDFSTPYYTSGAQLFIHKRHADEISSIEDCAGQRIGVVLGETFEHYLREHHPEIERVTYRSTVDIFQDVVNGRLVGFVSDRLLGAYQIRQEEMPFIEAGELLYQEHMGIPVHPDQGELLLAINTALETMRSRGEMDEIHERWFGLDGERVGSGSTIRPWTVTAMLVEGFVLTLFIALAAIIGGLILAIPAGIVLHRPSGVGRLLLRGIVDFLRGTPVLIQLFFVYFGLGSVFPGLGPITAAIGTLAVNAAAYMAEVVRSGLMAVDPGQHEAARALGLSRSQVFWRVVWPQAFRVAIPALMNSVVALIKDTALVSVITVPEVIRQAQSIISVTFDPTRYYLIVAVMFFVVTFPLMKLAGRLEARIRQRGFSHD